MDTSIEIHDSPEVKAAKDLRDEARLEYMTTWETEFKPAYKNYTEEEKQNIEDRRKAASLII